MSNSAIVRKIISGGPSTGHSGRARGLGNYAPPPASRGCGATKAAAKEARELLAPDHNRFTEGFETADH
jgi:hypothetical protein